MRRTRPLLLLAILFLVAAVGASYYLRVTFQKSTAQPVPAKLPAGIDAIAKDWHFSKKSDNGRMLVEVQAKRFRQITEPAKYELEDMELHLHHPDGSAYDKVKSAKADFDIGEGILFSEGEVEITLGVPADAPPSGRLMVIRSSGVHYESKTGKARTDRAASFGFDQGSGQSVGAEYDPTTRELHLKSQVKLDWRGRGENPKTMHVECDDLVYKERESKVYLHPWAKMTRDTLTLESGPAVVTLPRATMTRCRLTRRQGRRTYPRPRSVCMRRTGPLSILRRSEDTWTSTRFGSY